MIGAFIIEIPCNFIENSCNYYYFLQIMSTKTSTSETNGLTRVWGFTNALFKLVGFHTKSLCSLMDHIQNLLKASNFR